MNRGILRGETGSVRVARAARFVGFVGSILVAASSALAHGVPYGKEGSSLAILPVSPAHEDGYLVHSLRAPRIPAITDAAPQLSSISDLPPVIVGDIFVLEDDGTMIEDGVFVLDRVLPAFFTFSPDSFDLVSLFGASSFPDSMFASASQYIVRNHVAGLGMSADLNRNAAIGIKTSRLKSIQLMNDVRHFGPTPTADVPRFSVGFTGVELLGSEALHMRGCYVRVTESADADILGRLGAHWSFFFSSQASIMEGCRWQDNGDDTFTTIEVLNGISELDEYLMGLRPASHVAPMFVLGDPEDEPGPAGDATFPYVGFTTEAERIDFTIDDVIAQNGPRVPDSASSPHSFTMAFVLVVPAGESAPPADLAFLEQFRADWASYFFAETEELGSMISAIPHVPATAAFETDRIAGTPPLVVQFTARPSGTVAWLFWDFGDGSALSEEIRPMHTYSAPGVYEAKLTVVGFSGPSVATRTIRVGPFATIVAHDFEEDGEGWSPAAPNTATTGRWERDAPEGTATFGVFVQPDDDDSPNGENCWVTDADAGAFPLEFDVDAGFTTLVSPAMNLSAAADPYFSYSRWFSNSLGPRSDQDVMTIEVSDDGGANWALVETVDRTETVWVRRQFRLTDSVAPTASVRWRVQVSDVSGESLVEAAFDEFLVMDAGAVVASPTFEPDTAGRSGTLIALPNRPNPFATGTTVRYDLPATQSVVVTVHDLGGRLVRLLDSGVRDAGRREVAWDGRDEAGRDAAAGVYMVRVTTSAGAVTRKIQRLR